MQILEPESMSRRASPLAGSQVTIIGRFWVTTEVQASHTLFIIPWCYSTVGMKRCQ